MGGVSLPFRDFFLSHFGNLFNRVHLIRGFSSKKENVQATAIYCAVRICECGWGLRAQPPEELEV